MGTWSLGLSGVVSASLWPTRLGRKLLDFPTERFSINYRICGSSRTSVK